ncbi:MAG: histidine phosphatase family protein [Neisseria sp.]|nr:histidine phosphatase family protein [Neisseria sp.]
MKKIYLIRHAQSAANAGGSGDVVRFPNSEIPITDLGKVQAASLADWLLARIGQVNEIFVSPYLRAQQTAEPYLQKMNAQVTVLNDLHEFNYLSWANIQGKTFADLKTQAEQYWTRNDVDFCDGEDCDSFASFFQQISDVRRFFAQKDDGVYVVFGHGFWIGVLLWQLLGRDAQRVDMQKFREFELLVRPHNTDVYLWQIDDEAESVAKVRNSAAAVCSSLDANAFQAA